jgi:hypothetical protein
MFRVHMIESCGSIILCPVAVICWIEGYRTFEKTNRVVPAFVLLHVLRVPYFELGEPLPTQFAPSEHSGSTFATRGHQLVIVRNENVDTVWYVTLHFLNKEHVWLPSYCYDLLYCQ